MEAAAPAPSVAPMSVSVPTMDAPASVKAGGSAMASHRTYAVGEEVVCRASFDACRGTHAATIIDLRKEGGSGADVGTNVSESAKAPTMPEYYVHYLEFDKRLDEWVSSDRIVGSRTNEPKHGPGPQTNRSTTGAALALATGGAGTRPQANGHAAATPGAGPGSAMTPSAMTRHRKRKSKELGQATLENLDSMNPVDRIFEKQHRQTTKIKNVQVVNFGDYEIDAWYYSPYPIKETQRPESGAKASAQKPADGRTEAGKQQEQPKAAVEGDGAGGKAHAKEMFCTKPGAARQVGRDDLGAGIHARTEGIYRLFVCPQCFKYMKKRKTLARHASECQMQRPPGRLIYQNDPPPASAAPPHEQAEAASVEAGRRGVRVYEVDGNEQKLFCQNLCLFAKLFLDHKTLYFDVGSFNFYVICEYFNDGRCNVVGYFSKEKQSDDNYNLACILTLPHYQQMGVGNFMIELAYALSERQGIVGTPERPLSDMGLVCFRSYWRSRILQALKRHGTTLSLKDLAGLTGFQLEDVVSTLQPLALIRYWRGQHILSATPKIVNDYIEASRKAKEKSADPSQTPRPRLPAFNAELLLLE